jgi:histidine triad (HIT) family protein
LTLSSFFGKLRLYKEKESEMECLFCKIVSGEVLANIAYRDDLVLAFDDINPQAPHHKLIIPKKHISTINELKSEDNELVGHMIQTAQMLAKEMNTAEEGYRLVVNCNAAGGQTVFHVHVHLMGGRNFAWPPG